MIIVKPSPGQPPLAIDAMAEEASGVLAEAFAAISPWVRYPYPASQLKDYLSSHEHGAARCCIYSGTELAGAIGIRFNWMSGPYIQFFGLLPQYQGRGTGSRVLSALEDHSRQRDERNLWVAASDFNADAIRFYERHGFARVAKLEDLIRDGKTELLLRKRL